MATTTSQRQRVRGHLRSLELMLGDLPEVASEWGEISDGERESWSHDWDNEMGGLHLLNGWVAQGDLDEADLCRYRSILGQLNDAMPTLKRLNLQLPEFSREA